MQKFLLNNSQYHSTAYASAKNFFLVCWLKTLSIHYYEKNMIWKTCGDDDESSRNSTQKRENLLSMRWFFLLDKWDELQMKNARHEFDYLTSMTGAWEEKKLINSENVLWLSICVSSTTEIWCNFWNIMSIGGIDEF